MPTSNPDTWTAPQWHSDWGNAETEMERLRAFAKTLLVKCPEVTVSLEEPEEGYLYVDVAQQSKTIAEVYCVTDCENPRSWGYGVFTFKGDEEEENYCSTEKEAVALVEPLLMEKIPKRTNTHE